jgi:hypothetical protein
MAHLKGSRLRGRLSAVLGLVTLTFAAATPVSAQWNCDTSGSQGIRQAGAIYRTLTAGSNVDFRGIDATIDVQRPKTASGNYSWAYVQLQAPPGHVETAKFGILWRNGEVNGKFHFWMRDDEGHVVTRSWGSIASGELPYKIGIRKIYHPTTFTWDYQFLVDGVIEDATFVETHMNMYYARMGVVTSAPAAQVMGGTQDWMRFRNTRYFTQYGNASFGGPVVNQFAGANATYETNGSELWTRDNHCLN